MRHTEIIWSGWIHNAVSGSVFALLVCSLRSVPLWKERALARQRLRESLCLCCRYDLRGLNEPKCPECGQSRDDPPAEE